MTYNERIQETIEWWKKLIEYNPQFTKEDIEHCLKEIEWNEKQKEEVNIR